MLATTVPRGREGEAWAQENCDNQEALTVEIPNVAQGFRAASALARSQTTDLARRYALD